MKNKQAEAAVKLIYQARDCMCRIAIDEQIVKDCRDVARFVMQVDPKEFVALVRAFVKANR